ncbi:hypothetical protein CKO21_06625 [Rhodovibrio salinarum]|uniref:CysZ protein n=2 Tax=Rhodovibrio salinarum TaxID=1087 RepID=A0A934QHR2_9PROT|nr:hypothetical protein [Rhodovibrio salinarum]
MHWARSRATGSHSARVASAPCGCVDRGLSAEAMIQGVIKAIGQLSDADLRKIVWRALALAVVVFAGLWGLSWWLLDWAGGGLVAYIGTDGFWGGLIETLVELGGLAAVLIASFLLFPAVMGMTQGFFLEDAAGVVERKHYRDLPEAHDQPILEGVRDAVSLAFTTIILNVVILPVYLILSFIPPLNVIVFYALNGYLLGREYFEVVAVRRLTHDHVRTLRRRHRGRLTAAGVIITVMLTIPLVNLLAPVVATAFMVHVFERLRRNAGLPATRAAAA